MRGARKNLAGLAMMLLAGMFAVGCAARRTTTVDPLPDPAFRNLPGPLEYQAKSSRSRSRAPSGGSAYRDSTAPRGPWTVARVSDRWRYIIIHHSAAQNGGAESIDQYHRRPKALGGAGYDELGYHFVIGNGTDTGDGQIEVGSRWYKQKHGAHCRVPGDATNEYNEHGIGICLVGNFQYGPPSPAQMRSLIYLTKGLLAYTNLPPSAVHYHRDFKQTNCPGQNFPCYSYEQALRR